MNDLESTMTQKGQVTIPVAIRRQFGLRPKDRVRFAVDGDKVTLELAGSRLLAGFDAVKPHSRPEDWPRVREEFASLVAADVLMED